MVSFIRSHWLFAIPLAMFLGYYTFQNIAGFALLPNVYVWHMMAILVVSAVFYIGTYFFVPQNIFEASPISLSAGIVEALAIAGIIGYALLLFVAILTADEVALFEALRGASAEELRLFRETFLRTREGWGKVLHYGYVIANNSVMPIAVAYSFWRGRKWRFAALGLFVFGLSLTLQKGAIASAAIPLFALFLMQGRVKMALGPVGLALCTVAVMYMMASGRLANTDYVAPPASVATQESGKSDDLVSSRSVENASNVPPAYNLFGKDEQIWLAANRLIWIPYITAIDWLRYQQEVLDGALVMGRSMKPVAALIGVEPLQLEREVSRFQWGQNETGTASSNTVFSVDAYVNFGMVGVAIYSVIFALAIKLIATSGFAPLIASSTVPAYTAGFVALPPIFLSGGLAVFVILALVIRNGEKLDAASKDRRS